jgi:plastocyanin
LADLFPNRFGTITLGWYGCLTCTLTAANVNADITANVNVTLADDVDTSNNGSSATARGLLSSPIIGLALPSANAALCNNEVIEGIAATNRTAVDLRGRAAPNQQIVIRDGLTTLATVQSDGNGNFNHSATLGDGLHTITANYIVSPRDVSSGLPTGRLRLFVNPELPFDPSTVCFTDSQGRSYSVPTLGYSFGATQTGSWLRSGEPYQVSLSGLQNVPNQSYQVTFNDVVVTKLVDDDQDGVFVGQATFASALQAASASASGILGLVVGNSAGERTFSTDVAGAGSGVITDRTTGQPLANAEVTLLQAQEVEDSAAVMTAFAAQGTSQTTGSNGQYSLSADLGTYRIDVARAGYQPYRSADIDAATASLNPPIALSPAVPEAATHTVYLTADGFAPSALTVTPGSVVEFVNSDVTEHGVVGSAWDSGLLTPGGSYKVKLTTAGAFSYRDVTDTLTNGLITVSDATPAADHALFLPIVQR